MTYSLATIGLMYIDGQGCTKDEEAGIQWLRKSLEGGSVYGTGMLSYQYFTRKLFSKAAECAHKYVPPKLSACLVCTRHRQRLWGLYHKFTMTISIIIIMVVTQEVLNIGGGLQLQSPMDSAAYAVTLLLPSLS